MPVLVIGVDKFGCAGYPTCIGGLIETTDCCCTTVETDGMACKDGGVDVCAGIDPKDDGGLADETGFVVGCFFRCSGK